jgi:hypothetical protein
VPSASECLCLVCAPGFCKNAKFGRFSGSPAKKQQGDGKATASILEATRSLSDRQTLLVSAWRTLSQASLVNPSLLEIVFV